MSNFGKIKLKIYSDKEDDSKTAHYHIGLEYDHPRFSINFMSPERFTRTEAQARVMRIAVDLDAETDFIMLANEIKLNLGE